MTSTLQPNSSVAQGRWDSVSNMLSKNNIDTLVVRGVPLVGA